MKYDHMVKINGKYYRTGEDVPENGNKAAENNSLPNSDIMSETKEDKPYTKTDINKMNKAELTELAKGTGVEGADEMTGTELKEYLCSVFGL